MVRAVVVGAGAVGARAARQLLGSGADAEIVLVDPDAGRAGQVAASLGPQAGVQPWDGVDLDRMEVAVLAQPSGGHRPLAERCLEAGTHVVSVADDLAEATQLADLGTEAAERGLHVVVGAGFAPGLSCVLARHASAGLSTVDEVHVAKSGTGGRACARQHHGALAGEAVDWRDGGWVRRRAGSGRELCWFPDPIGGLDCYRAVLPDPRLLHPAFPASTRITARMSASRRDRVTARLPMLRRPHPEGSLGAIRVEVRGRRGATTEVRVLGAIDRPAVAAGTVAALAAQWAVTGRLARTGAGGLAELVGQPVDFLHDLAERGVRAAVFEGAGAA